MYRDQRPTRWARILPIQATILNEVFPNLRKLTLHQRDNDQVWDDDLDNVPGKSDETKFDEAVQKVVVAAVEVRPIENLNLRMKGVC